MTITSLGVLTSSSGKYENIMITQFHYLTEVAGKWQNFNPMSTHFSLASLVTAPVVLLSVAWFSLPPPNEITTNLFISLDDEWLGWPTLIYVYPGYDFHPTSRPRVRPRTDSSRRWAQAKWPILVEIRWISRDSGVNFNRFFSRSTPTPYRVWGFSIYEHKDIVALVGVRVNVTFKRGVLTACFIASPTGRHRYWLSSVSVR